MLKIFFLQKWYALADVSVEEEIWDRKSFQKFLNIDAGSDGVPDATTLENFRHTLEESNTGEKIFMNINRLLSEQGLILQNGTSVDATIIAAPSSTKNQEKKRDPDMKQTKKGNQWYFGMKLHCGTDSQNGCIHTIQTSGANEHDSLYFEKCLHGEEKVVFADKAYQKKERVQYLRSKGVCVQIHRKARKGEKLSKRQEEENQKRSRVRSKTEHPFHILKNIFGWKKVCYR
jgi:IS5 family transposase